MSNHDYLKEYKEGQESYKEASYGIALDQFNKFIHKKAHPKNSLELSNAYRYIAKLQYEEGEYMESLKTWCHKRTRSCFTWKDFYSRALAGLFGFKEKMNSGSYILLFKTTTNYEYTILDAIIDIRMAKRLMIEEKENDPTAFLHHYQENWKRNKVWLIESYHNIQYYETIFINLLYNIKNFTEKQFTININLKKYKIYNEKINSILKSELYEMNESFESNSCEFEDVMKLYTKLYYIKLNTAKQFSQNFQDKDDLLRFFGENEDNEYRFNVFKFIPKQYIDMEKYKLKNHLFSMYNKLNSKEKKWQQDIWNAEFPNKVFDLEDLNLKSTWGILSVFSRNDWKYDRTVTSFSHFYYTWDKDTSKLESFFNSLIFNNRFQICLNALLENEFDYLFLMAEQILRLREFYTDDELFGYLRNEREFRLILPQDFSLFSICEFQDFEEQNFNNTVDLFLDVIFLKYLILKKRNNHFNNNPLNIEINHQNFFKKLNDMNMMIHYENNSLTFEIHQLLSGDLELINEDIVDKEIRDHYNEIIKQIRNESKVIKSVELFYNRKDDDEFTGQLINYFKHKYKLY